jgi:PAS domain S-box-containing protein
MSLPIRFQRQRYCVVTRGAWRSAAFVVLALAALAAAEASGYDSATEEARALSAKAIFSDIIRRQYAFEHLSQEQGLSYNTVTSFAQDKQGFLWIATFNGLNRYDGAHFKTFPQRSADSGLAAMPRAIRLLYADSEGYLWIAGFDNSIGRFNPNDETFTNFALSVKGVQRDFINSFLEDAAGTLWMTTIQGLFYFDRSRQAFLPHLASNGKPLIAQSLGGIEEFPAASDRRSFTVPRSFTDHRSSAEERRIWIRKHGGLIEFDPVRNSVQSYDFIDIVYEKKIFYGNLVRDSLGYLWCSDVEGLYCFDVRAKSVLLHIQRKTFARESFIKNPLQNDFMTRCALCAPDGSLWFGSSGGIVIVRYRGYPQQYSFDLLQNDEANPFSLSGNTVRTLFADKAGVIWAGGEPYGINKFTPYRQKFLLFRHLPFNSNSLSNNYLRGLCLTRNNVLWVGTQFGGVSRYDPRRRLWTRFRNVLGKKSSDPQGVINETWSIFEDHFGVVWAGTRGNGLLRFDERLGGFVQSPLVSKNALVQIIREDRAGNLLVGTRGNTFLIGLFMIPPDRKKENVEFIQTHQDSSVFLSGDVQALYEDRQGFLWIGGASEILRFHPKTRALENKTPQLFQDVGKLQSNVGSVATSFIEDRNGVLWFSTKGLGIIMYDRVRDRFVAVDERRGLPNNATYAILEDAAGNFWISSDAGLTRWNRSANTFQTFTTADGLQGREYNRLSYWKSPDGVMFFGGINGLNVFHPDNLPLNPNPPPIALTSLGIFAEEKTPGSVIGVSSAGLQTLTLRYDQNFVTFQFAALDFHVPENNRYRYKLEGVDKNWVEAGAKREAAYTDLAPGDYTFLVRAANNDGVWNDEGLALRVLILPPWWATWQFRTALILLGIGSFGLVLQNYRRRIRRLQEHRKELLLHIEERERAEKELQRSEEKFRALFEVSTLGMVLWQNDGEILEVNAAFVNLLGYAAQEVGALNFWQVLGETNSGAITYSLQQRRTFGPIEQTLSQQSGDKIAVVMYGIAIGNQGGHQDFERIWSVVEDITERKRAIDALLRYQINPHFMFNVLNSVNALMIEDQNSAKQMIIQFSSLLRHTLVASSRQTAPLGEEIDAVEHYLAIEKIRFEERLDAVIHADRATLGLNVPVFLIQPLVENAIKYGMRSKQKTLHIAVSCRIEGDALCMEVTNTGTWVANQEENNAKTAFSDNLTKKRSTGIGLANLRKRLEQYYAASQALTISEEQGMVRVRITIALKELSNAPNLKSSLVGVANAKTKD